MDSRLTDSGQTDSGYTDSGSKDAAYRNAAKRNDNHCNGGVMGDFQTVVHMMLNTRWRYG